MTIRKMWLIILVLVSVVAITINSLILVKLTDQYFKEYLTENYNQHVEEIKNYVVENLSADNIESVKEELIRHLQEPIVKIEVYAADVLMIVVKTDDSETMMSFGNRKMPMMENFFKSTLETNDHIIVTDEGLTRRIVTYSEGTAENSFVAHKFQSSLLKNSIFSIAIALVMALLIGLIVSQKMTKALKDTVIMANNIQFTSSKQFEETKIEEINAIRTSLKTLDQRLHIKHVVRKELMDQVVHQTQTPITVLKTHLEAIGDGVIEFNDDELMLLNGQIDQITHVLDNLDLVLEAEDANEPIEISSFDIKDLLSQIVSGLKIQFKQKEVTLKTHNSSSIIIKSDYQLLTQVIYNIVTNALKYTENGGEVMIDYKVVGEALNIKITDTGIGINKENMHRIFDIYYRVKGLDVSGHGIGLYIAKKHVTRLFGKIDVESEINKGSTFEIRLPIDHHKKP